MLKKIDWESQIGRRLKMRDLHVLFTVVQRGSMAKAAAHLGVAAPTAADHRRVFPTVSTRRAARRPDGDRDA